MLMSTRHGAGMTELASIPLSRMSPLGRGIVRSRTGAVALVSDRRQWTYCAEAAFPLPGIETEARTIRIEVEVQSGVLGVGWLRWDEADWVTRTSASGGAGAMELKLTVPARTSGGKLVFDNWTPGGQPVRGVVRSITVMPPEAVGIPERPAAARTVPAAELPVRQLPRPIIEKLFQSALVEEERGDREAAISHYKSVLGADPSHVESIAGLGRLRFIRPDQPFLNELKRRAPVDVCQVVIEVRNPCNYRCFYCVAAGKNNEPVQRFDLERIEKAYSQIHAKVIGTTLECGGGEPTVHPQFPELLRICSSHGAVDFPSNNSQDPKRWLPKDSARRISIRSALHPESEPNLDRYLRFARYLIDAGCAFLSTYIAHPTRLSKIPEYRELFDRYGLGFQTVAFIGTYEGRSYPHSYTEEEKRLLGLEEESRYWLHKIEPHTTRIRNFRGIPCIAGYHSIYIKSDGSLRRCMYDEERVLEAPLQKAEPCGVKNCGCGLYLEKLNSVELVDFYNDWGGKAGVETIPTDWMEPLAHGLGYAGSQDAMTAEGIKMYDALMSAYGKDEFPE
jgi:MoaA/NifB/PqqE/SkfB family radical SAM enzyme